MSETRGGRHGDGSEGRLRRIALGAAALASAALLGACPNAGEDRVLSVPGTALIGGVVYLDADGNRTPGGPDVGLSGVRVRLLVAGTRDTAARASTDANGVFVFGSMPVGRYTVVVPGEPSWTDTIAVVRVDTADVDAAPDDTVNVAVAVSYPAVGVAAARALPLGRKVFVDGVALNTRGVFGDTTVHVADTSAAIRVTRARGPIVAPGDSVRVLGKVAARDGQPVLDEGTFTVLALVGAPVARGVTTLQAATADGGGLDAALIRVVDAGISDTTTAAGDYLATVDDGSGALRVVFDGDISFATMRSRFVPGAVIDARGVLVPDAIGGWVLKPRSDADVVLK